MLRGGEMFPSSALLTCCRELGSMLSIHEGCPHGASTQGVHAGCPRRAPGVHSYLVPARRLSFPPPTSSRIPGQQESSGIGGPEGPQPPRMLPHTRGPPCGPGLLTRLLVAVGPPPRTVGASLRTPSRPDTLPALHRHERSYPHDLPLGGHCCHFTDREAGARRG